MVQQLSLQSEGNDLLRIESVVQDPKYKLFNSTEFDFPGKRISLDPFGPLTLLYSKTGYLFFLAAVM